MSRHAIFDLDGTLVDSVAICTQLLNAMLADRGSDRIIAPDQARPHVSLGGTRMVAALLAAECGDPEAEIAEFRARYSEAPTPQDSLFPGVRAGLAKLRERSIRLSLCSNKPQQLCEKVLSDLCLGDSFDCVIGGRPNVAPKPASALLDLTLASLGADAGSCCFVGDSELDHHVACAAGMPFIFVTYGYCDENWDFSGVSHCHSFAEVPDNVCALLDDYRPAIARARAARG